MRNLLDVMYVQMIAKWYLQFGFVERNRVKGR